MMNKKRIQYISTVKGIIVLCCIAVIVTIGSYIVLSKPDDGSEIDVFLESLVGDPSDSDIRIRQIGVDGAKPIQWNSHPHLSVIVENRLYSELKQAIIRYCLDIEKAGESVALYLFDGGTAAGLRQFLQLRNQSGLQGAFFIGSLPLAWFYTGHCPLMEPVSERFPSDVYFMDLDGIFEDLDGDSVLDSHKGDLSPEIWISRLNASGLSGTEQKEIDFLKNYFDKVRRYRSGDLALPQRSIAIVSAEKHDKLNFDGTAFDEVLFADNSDIRYRFFKKLREGYELVQIAANGSPYQHIFNSDFQNHSIAWEDILISDPAGFFFLMGGPAVLRYTSENNIAKCHIFGKSNGLVAAGSTKGSRWISFQRLIDRLNRGDNFGFAFKHWLSEQILTHSGNTCVYGGYAMIGDPMLQLQRFQRNGFSLMDKKNKIR